jgi:hypothetical protein
MNSPKSDRAQVERPAPAERRSVDPPATKPAQARGMLYIVVSALVIAAVLLALMWVKNSRYDGNSPIPARDSPGRASKSG